MKYIVYIAAVIISSTIFTSCTKVIDANLDESPSLLIIEGGVPDSAKPWVRITRMVDVERDNNFPGVTGAVVTITDNAGNSTQLLQSAQGTYFGSTIIGVPGRTYTLKVELDGKVYTSASTMPVKVFIDSLTVDDFGFGGPANENLLPVLNYTDPAGLGNNYRAVLWHNDTLRTDIFIEDDKYADGNSREALLFSQDYRLKKGDRFVIELQCIDKAVYDYFTVLLEVDGSSGLASPANPSSNITGGALGYFSAYTAISMEKVVE